MKTIKSQISKLALLSVVVFFSSCGGGEEQKTQAGATDSTVNTNDKTKTVEVISLQTQVFNNYVEVQGKVDADENVSVNAEMPGTVSKIYVHLGDQVSTGQVLAELDSKVIQQGIAEVQGALDLANTLFEKQKTLWDQKIGTEVQFLGAKNQKESLEKRLASLQEQLKMSRIVSPINGIVDAVDIKLGQATMPGLPAMRVVNMNSLKVKGEVAESYLAKVKSGNDVIIIFPDMMDTVRTKISYAAKVISPLNRTFTATVNLDGKKEYHPNMIAIMRIIDYSNPKAFVVPVSTVQKAQDGDFIFIAVKSADAQIKFKPEETEVKGDKVIIKDPKAKITMKTMAKKVKVKVGRTYNGSAEILEGLNEGDLLIIKGFQELNEGELINL